MIQPTTRDMQSGHGSSAYVVWENIGANDVCAPVQYRQALARTVHIYGLFGGATVGFVGSNEAPDEQSNDASAVANLAPLHDGQGNIIAVRETAIETVQEATNWIAPQITKGSEATSVTVAMLFRSQK